VPVKPAVNVLFHATEYRPWFRERYTFLGFCLRFLVSETATHYGMCAICVHNVNTIACFASLPIGQALWSNLLSSLTQVLRERVPESQKFFIRQGNWAFCYYYLPLFAVILRRRPGSESISDSLRAGI
jgi:hypothetical protein